MQKVILYYCLKCVWNELRDKDWNYCLLKHKLSLGFISFIIVDAKWPKLEPNFDQALNDTSPTKPRSFWGSNSLFGFGFVTYHFIYSCYLIEEHILGINAGKKLSWAATDV